MSEAAEAVPERRSSKIETPVSEESVMKEDAGKRLLARVLFCACAEARSLTKERKTLGLHAEEAETLLNALTREAAEPLFRVTNGVFTLTDAGIQRFRKWKEPASSLYQADPVTAEEPGYESLAVSVPTTTGVTLLSPLIVRFAESRPGLRIDIRLTHGTYHPLWEGVDLRVGHGEYFMEDVETHPLGALTRICVAAPEYLEANGTPENPEDLERHLFFGPKDAVDPGFLTFTRGKSVRRVHAESRVSLRSHLSALFCALSGEGIGVLVPAYLAAPYLDSGKLVHVLPQWHSLPIPLRAFIAKETAPGVLRDLVRFLEEACRQNPFIESIE